MGVTIADGVRRGAPRGAGAGLRVGRMKDRGDPFTVPPSGLQFFSPFSTHDVLATSCAQEPSVDEAACKAQEKEFW